MALFDQFGPAQSNNGQAPPSPQATSGAPGFPFGSWGNQPPNMAGGLQQFLAARGMAQPQPGGMAGGIMPGGAVTPQQQQPGIINPPTSPVQPPPAGAAVMPQTGNPMVASQGSSSAAVMPQGATAGASSPYGATNFAGGMQPFIGARR